MSKEMIISVNGREKKIAILDNGRVTEFYIERGEENSGIVGNIYKGRVQRVLPGMQSAFVEIGLERDAFLYVSDFFDEEEEIERIVMEKSKKASPEEAKREAVETVERARHEREKHMEEAQEIAEPLAEAETAPVDDEITTTAEPDRARKGRRRGRKGREETVTVTEMEVAEQPVVEVVVEAEEPFVFEIDDSGFERVVDDEDTGDLFKDAFLQEAIVDKVRAIEFEMEATDAAEVGSLIGTVGAPSGFERIADEEETESAPAKGRTPAKKGKGAGKAKAAKEPAKPKTKSAGAAGKKTTTRKKKAEIADSATEGDQHENAEASVKEASETSEMTVRRGGRGRRRGGRGRKPGEKNGERVESSDSAEGGFEENEIIEAEEPAAEASAAPKESSGRDGRGKGHQSGNGRRSDRGDRGDRRERPAQPTISDLLREGQEILVQIAKEPIARKGARITSHIALPGRYLVYMPTIEHLGVSRKIESSNERGRLRTLIQRIRQDNEIPSGGFIVRTAGVGISEEDLRNDAKYLVRTWQDIKKSSEKAKSPALVHQDLDLVQRLLRDQLSDDFTAIRVDSEDEYLRTVEFINRMQPRMVKRVKLYTRDEPILDAYNVQEEIDKALKPRVWLKSGGYLVINQTEALVAIDVNTGKFVGKGNARLEDTITRTNLEAVDEIARQIRLRDLGGIIVLDLIDMEDRRNRHKVSQALQEALSTDKSPTKVLSFNDFGLIIMTRKRVKQSLERTLCSPCEYCEGAGWVKSPQTVCYEILAEARRLSKTTEDVRQTTLRIHPDVAKA
ncbi:MAG TPA: Rne/Rng family ribonuclease, partial [Pyrinomonadaceae bacterium]|nr:Rne/Rng family ribonuclease [Pyrinomonadaceae bacterium]